MIRLDDLLAHAARADPGRDGAVFGREALSYGELDHRAARFAGLLRGWGVEPGDRVALWASNRLEFPEFLFGTARAGGTAVPLDHWWTAEETAAALDRCRPRVLLADGHHAEALGADRERLAEAGVERRVALDEDPPTGWESYPRLVAAADPLRAPVPVGLDAPVLILFTSGSTGRSKGAVHTHRDLAHTAQIMALELGLREGERTVHPLPLFSSCLEHLIPLTLVRATHIILPGADAGELWEAVEREAATHLDAVPTVMARLLAAAPDRLPPSLRSVSYASEPMPPALIRRWVERAPQVAFVEFYGMIEQLCLTVRKPWEQVASAGTVGRPMLGARIRLVDEDGHDVAAGGTGEVTAATPTLMAGYWEDPAATDRIVRDGWMRTGDLGRFDDAGRLVLEGRRKDIIKSGGMTVIPREVEDHLLEHPAILEAAVIGIPDDRWGEAVHAFVTFRSGGVDPADLSRHCRSSLAAYKCPKRIHVMAQLPRTGIGKIARRQLRTMASKGGSLDSAPRPAGLHDAGSR